MFDRLRARLLAVLRVPEQPHPPFGAPGSVRIFRAARNLYYLRLFGWATGQILTFFGIVVSLFILTEIKQQADEVRYERRAAAARAAGMPPPAAPPSREKSMLREMMPDQLAAAPTAFLRDPHHPIGRLIEHQPGWLFPLINVLKIGGILFYLLQLPLTYAIVRLEFESHWYIVTDRSLRIRTGLIVLREATMSFANIQQVTVTQGPLQRLLGIADVRVQSAGGGGQSGSYDGSTADSMHLGVFHGVDNAAAIRDLILERLRAFRAAGLGDPDEHHELITAAALPERSETSSEVLAAAHSVLEEARALRAALP